MAVDPLNVIAECLGERAHTMRNPANADYQCPYINGRCTKKNHTNTLPLPVCSLYRRGASPTARVPVCVCPARFYEANIADDVIRECWVGAKPTRPRIAYEVKMDKFGKVDLVIAELDASESTVRNFLPVELQAVDINGSYMKAFEALTQSQQITSRFNYGFNWGNVRKRFMSQLVAKGYFCHHWNTRIVAVIQEDLFAEFSAHAKLTEVKTEDSNIVFMLYQFQRTDDSAAWELRLRRVFPTTHLSVMQSVLYEKPPSKEKFEQKILARINA